MAPPNRLFLRRGGGRWGGLGDGTGGDLVDALAERGDLLLLGIGCCPQSVEIGDEFASLVVFERRKSHRRCCRRGGSRILLNDPRQRRTRPIVLTVGDLPPSRFHQRRRLNVVGDGEHEVKD